MSDLLVREGITDTLKYNPVHPLYRMKAQFRAVVQALGRITIPHEDRKALGIFEGDTVVVGILEVEKKE